MKKSLNRPNTNHKACLWSAILVALCLCPAHSLRAHSLPSDSLTRKNFPFFAVTGGLLVGSGIIGHFSDHQYSKKQTEYLPQRNSRIDDVCRWLPTITHIGLALGGFEETSSIKRDLTSCAFGYILDIGLTEGLKRTIKQRRPDGSDRESTPSGHAAYAYFSAARLDMEYGYLSPFITIGGYAASAAVAFDRTLDNRHYASDVIMGAGIGILASKTSYLLYDWLFKKDQKQMRNNHPEDLTLSDDPSFIGLYSGYAVSLQDYPTQGNLSLHQQPGLDFGIEGAYFPWKHFGFGGRVSESRSILELNKQPINAWIDCFTALAGIYTSYSIRSKVHFGAKLLTGYAVQTGGRDELRTVNALPVEGHTVDAGFQTGCLIRKKLDLSLQLDYKAIYASHTVSYLTPALTLNYSF